VNSQGSSNGFTVLPFEVGASTELRPQTPFYEEDDFSANFLEENSMNEHEMNEFEDSDSLSMSPTTILIPDDETVTNTRK
jgi:hypothetical protein